MASSLRKGLLPAGAAVAEGSSSACPSPGCAQAVGACAACYTTSEDCQAADQALAPGRWHAALLPDSEDGTQEELPSIAPGKVLENLLSTCQCLSVAEPFAGYERDVLTMPNALAAEVRMPLLASGAMHHPGHFLSEDCSIASFHGKTVSMYAWHDQFS